MDDKQTANLLAILSHDLKAPTRRARTMSDYVKEVLEPHLSKLPPDEAEKVSDGLNRIATHVTSIYRLIESLVAFARTFHEGLPSAGDPTTALNLALVDLQESGEWSERVMITRVGLDSAPMVALSVDGLRLLWRNLLSNAIKFSEPEDVLNIHVGQLENGAGAILYVSDDGVGISEEVHARILATSESLNGNHDGSGVGLALCKLIVERVGGSMSFISKPGQGSIFSMTIPYAPAKGET